MGETQHQSSEQMERSKQLSLARTRPPTTVPGYEMECFLGSGAYGEVWVATDHNTGRRVAIKFYTHRGGVDWSLLSREVEKLVFLSTDRYVVQLLDVGWDSDPPYYVMDYLEHGSLDDCLDRRGTFSVHEAIDLFHELANGLLHAHAKGVLHCDLKPANVLLDQDDKPRLADFGQSRLSHEQTPSLGTLFYMAPEQADLAAVPDARWDVYALGAMVYCALMGQPPYRSEDAATKLDSAESLSDRLKTYRHVLQNSPAPTAHRKLPGMDRPLADIIERCLAVHPQDRFANIQEVVDALQRRDATRARRPLVLLGFVGPLLLLLIMTFFGWRGFDRAKQESEDAITQRALEKNRFAAKAVSGKAAEEISRYFRAVQDAATDDEFLALLQSALAEDSALAPYRAKFTDANENGILTKEREKFRSLPQRQELQALIEKLAVTTPDAASWFVVDPNGVQLASVFVDGQVKQTVGKNYGWRTYFHGGPDDLVDRDEDGLVLKYHRPTHPVDATHISAPFQSTATYRWKVAVSEPIMIDGQFAGVVALTVNIGNFLRFEESVGTTFFASLVDTRAGESRGMVLQHQAFESWYESNTRIPDEMLQVRAPLDAFKSGLAKLYHDPLWELRSEQQGDVAPGVFLAAIAPVQVQVGRVGVTPNDGDRANADDTSSENPDATSNADGPQATTSDTDDSSSPNTTAEDATEASPTVVASVSLDTGLAVVVQESFSAVIQPVDQLGQRLLFEGGLALLLLFVVVLVLWGVVLRVLRDPENEAAIRGRARVDTARSAREASTLPAVNRGRVRIRRSDRPS